MANSEKPLNLAIIGCGVIGRKRALNLPESYQLITACDLNEDSAAEVARSGGRDVRIETDVAAVVTDPRIDVVMICATNAALSDLALKAVSAAKHVLIEKPGGRSASELRAVADAAAQTGALVRIGYNHRYHPALLKARELIDSGICGEPMFIRSRYGHGGRVGYEKEWRADSQLSGGGELIDQGVHLIDLASWFLGDFTKIDGHATTSYWDMPVDDNAFLSLRTEKGQTAWLHVSCSEWKNLFSFEYYGRDGKLQIDGLGGSYGVEKLTLYKMLPEMGPPETIGWEYPKVDQSWRVEMEEFAEDIRLNRIPSPGLEEGIATLDIVRTVYERSGYPTKF